MSENASGGVPNLQEHFQNQDPTTHVSRWEELWTKQHTPWDRGAASPALIDLLSSKHSDLPDPQNGTKRLKALVPGCGTGYDVVLLASHGYESYGLDASATAAKAAQELFEQSENASLKGQMTIVTGNFFADEAWANVPGFEHGNEQLLFDLIYDYTFFCALPPEMRPKWAARMSQLLAPQGRLVCLEFPTYKAPSAAGPPWGLRPLDYVAHLSRPGEPVERDADGFVVSSISEEKPERSASGLVRIAHWQTERTHESGKGTDWISIWRHQ